LTTSGDVMPIQADVPMFHRISPVAEN